MTQIKRGGQDNPYFHLVNEEEKIPDSQMTGHFPVPQS